MPAADRITDLAHPRLPWPVAAFNRLARPLALRHVRFDADRLLVTARRRSGLSDFGDDAFREPLGIFLAALEREAHLSALGRLMARELVLQLLTTRLRARALVAHHPEILAEEIRAPIFIVGLPRTGTTHLHNLLSQHAALRSLPYWESLEPVPAGGRPPAPGGRDPRPRRCAWALRFQHYVLPLFRRMHEMEPEARHEEIQLLAVTFSTMLLRARRVDRREVVEGVAVVPAPLPGRQPGPGDGHDARTRRIRPQVALERHRQDLGEPPVALERRELVADGARALEKELVADAEQIHQLVKRRGRFQGSVAHGEGTAQRSGWERLARPIRKHRIRGDRLSARPATDKSRDSPRLRCPGTRTQPPMAGGGVRRGAQPELVEGSWFDELATSGPAKRSA